MAKKKTETDTSPEGLAALALSMLSEGATSGEAYQLGDHADHTWGIQIPSLAFQWAIGGSSVFPCQRWLSTSGEPGAMKSTLIVEILKWFSMQQGIGIYIDNESKTSASMLEAMTWWCLTDAQRKLLILKPSESIEEWMTTLTQAVALAQKLGYGANGSRVPVCAIVDSLTGKGSVSEQETIEDEGFAQARGFPTKAAMISRYLEGIQLTDTLMSAGFVRHLKTTIDGGGAHGPPPKKETGGMAAQFKASLSLRLTKFGNDLEFADHPAMPHRDLTTVGKTVIIQADKSCLGPDKRKLWVEVLWQYVPQEDGTSKQLMKWNWEGALGGLLHGMKYGDDKVKAYAQDIERLNKSLEFSNPKGKLINCKELGLEEVSLTEFGAAIEGNPDVRARISRFLNIAQYKDVQEVELKPLKARE